jgi:hypothetical protein
LELELGQLELAMLAAIGLFVVILVALIVYVISASRKKRPERAVRMAIEPTVRLALPVSGHALSLVRDERGGRLQVEVDGTRYGRLKDVEDQEIQRTIVAAAMELIQFTGALDEGVAEPAPMERTQTWREDLRQGSEAELLRAKSLPAEGGDESQEPAVRGDVEQRFLNLLAEMGQAPTQPEKPGIMSAIQHRYLSKNLGPEESRTFVDDIEAIVQRRVQLIPALQGKGLHVRPGPVGKVHFAFGGKEYESVDDIPNLTAQQVIRDAIREWDEAT